MTTPPGDVTSGHVVNATSSSSSARADDGDLLWLWYVVLTVVLLALILASFVRFHYKRVQQLRQRLDAEMTYGVKRRHLTPSPSASNVAATPAAVVNLDTQRLLTSHHNDVRGGHAADLEVTGHHQRSRGHREDGDVKRAPVVYTFNANGTIGDAAPRCGSDPQVRGHERSSATDLGCRASKVRGHRRSSVVYALLNANGTIGNVARHGSDPEVRGHKRSWCRAASKVKGRRRSSVVYAFNANGSMVDVRCEQVERCNTAPPARTARPPCCRWR